MRGKFDCKSNKLTSLEGVPKEVGGDFDCERNKIESLKGAPKEVGGWFACSFNKLTSLKGAPKSVGGHFYCRNNNLTTLDGAPKEVGGSVYSEIVKPHRIKDWDEYYLTHFKGDKWSEDEIPFEEMDKVKLTKLLAKRLGGK